MKNKNLLIIVLALFLISACLLVVILEEDNKPDEIHGGGAISPLSENSSFNCTSINGTVYSCKKEGEICACLEDGSCVCD